MKEYEKGNLTALTGTWAIVMVFMCFFLFIFYLFWEFMTEAHRSLLFFVFSLSSLIPASKG